MSDMIHCINGPAFADRLHKAMGKRETDRASLDTFSSDLCHYTENIERVREESGSSFEWLRHLQTALLGERAVLVASGWNRQSNYEGVWIWERDPKERDLMRGLSKAQASDLLTGKIVPMERSARLRLAPMKDSRDFRVPLLTTGLVADAYWSQPFMSRRSQDELTPGPSYHEN